MYLNLSILIILIAKRVFRYYAINNFLLEILYLYIKSYILSNNWLSLIKIKGYEFK